MADLGHDPALAMESVRNSLRQLLLRNSRDLQAMEALAICDAAFTLDEMLGPVIETIGQLPHGAANNMNNRYLLSWST